MAKKCFCHKIDLNGVSERGEPAFIKSNETIYLDDADVRVHETGVGGAVILVPDRGELSSYSVSEVYLRVIYADGTVERLMAPIGTPIDLKSVNKIRLNLLAPVGNPAARRVTYRGHASAHCIYELLESSGPGPMFAGLGNWKVRGMSADGSVLVGMSETTTGNEAARWTQGTGLVGLGHFPEGTSSYATAASSDGSVIVGASNSGTSDQQAFRWTAATGLVNLGTLPGDDTSTAQDVSADGSVVVGQSGSRAMVWTESAGIQALPGADIRSIAKAVSADGTVILGDNDFDGPHIVEAFRWTEASGIVMINDTGSRTHGASADGNTVVGMDGDYDQDGTTRRGTRLARMATGASG